ncbi:MAG: carbon storage regulator CsrA [Nitrospiraceae bacterium]|jgi:carbon storage regulator|nr:MAG: carbon storage regulator CsrA [Nitrospiraceae bacterium]
MLVLTRKSDESINLGDDITITVVEIKGNSVRLGIKAPEKLKIYRKELYDRIKKENLLSSNLLMEQFTKIRSVLRSK